MSVLQPIRVQTSASTVEAAVLHIMEGTANASELRVSAMHEINPLHTFMFSSRGKVLNANTAALEACRYSGTDCRHGMTCTSATTSACSCNCLGSWQRWKHSTIHQELTFHML